MQIVDRYLELLKNSLLNEIYIESDVRLLYLFERLLTKQNIDLEVFQHVRVRLPDLFSKVVKARQDGGIWWRLDQDSICATCVSSLTRWWVASDWITSKTVWQP
jgi:hypothetical protein